MKILFLIVYLLPLTVFAQSAGDKIKIKAILETDPGKIRAYYISSTDSIILLSHKSYYDSASVFTVPVDAVRKLKLKDKEENNVGYSFMASVLGFVLVAGLSQNDADVDQDGKTSFWELVFAAIEGTTSSDRRRRRGALIAGTAGGLTIFVATLFGNKQFSLVFPLADRRQFYRSKQYEINNYTRF